MGKLIDITNQKFGRLTVLEKTSKRNSCGQVYWRCICECGKECEVSGTALRTGHTKSCGCYNIEETIKRGQSKLQDLTGQTFGLLTVLYRAKNHIQPGGQSKTMWHCKCSCGKECDILADSLKSGTSKSCGCLYISHGELLISQILDKEKIPYKMEYSFENCVLPSNKLARFDFYVNNQYIIEYDGKQHFNKDDGWNEPLENIQKRDIFKNQYCLNNNIPLYRIPYTDYNNINSLKDILQDKYLVKQINHYNIKEPL